MFARFLKHREKRLIERFNLKDFVVVLDQDVAGVLTRRLEPTHRYTGALSMPNDRPSN